MRKSKKTIIPTSDNTINPITNSCLILVLLDIESPNTNRMVITHNAHRNQKKPPEMKVRLSKPSNDSAPDKIHLRNDQIKKGINN